MCSPASTSSTFPARRAGFDNDYAAQARACLASLARSRPFFLLHVEATDEAGHQGLVDVKVDALERWDRDVIGPIVDALDAAGDEPYRILLLPDHATPCTIKTHTADPVPYLLFDSTDDRAGGDYTEAGDRRSCRRFRRTKLMERLVSLNRFRDHSGAGAGMPGDRSRVPSNRLLHPAPTEV